MAVQAISVIFIILITLAVLGLVSYWIYHGYKPIVKPIVEPIVKPIVDLPQTVIPVEDSKKCSNDDCSLCQSGWGPKWDCSQEVAPYWDMVQLKSPDGRYILLRKDDLNKRDEIYDGDFSAYKRETVTGSDGIERLWSFRVYTSPDVDREEWCVFRQLNDKPNFTIYRGDSKCKSRYKSDEAYVYSFWVPKALAPNVTSVHVERNVTDPKQTKYRIRNLNQPSESGWELYIVLVTPLIQIN